MTLNDISERYGLEDEERRIFAEYTGFTEAEVRHLDKMW